MIDDVGGVDLGSLGCHGFCLLLFGGVDWGDRR